MELPDRTKVLLDNAYKQMIHKEAKGEQKLIGDREFIQDLDQYSHHIAEERRYEVA